MIDEPISCRCAAPGFLEPHERCAYCGRIEPWDDSVELQDIVREKCKDPDFLRAYMEAFYRVARMEEPAVYGDDPLDEQDPMEPWPVIGEDEEDDA